MVFHRFKNHSGITFRGDEDGLFNMLANEKRSAEAAVGLKYLVNRGGSQARKPLASPRSRTTPFRTHKTNEIGDLVNRAGILVAHSLQPCCQSSWDAAQPRTIFEGTYNK